MPTRTDIREAVTEKIVAALKAGTPPWRRPWAGASGPPTNCASGRAYRGVNLLLLGLVAAERGYRSGVWGTFRQWADRGCSVRPRPAGVPPGGWGTHVVFLKPPGPRPTRDEQDDPDADDRGAGGYLLLRQYVVFAADQVEGAGAAADPAPATPAGFADCGPAERAVAATGARVEHRGGRAAYSPSEDAIRLPPKGAFSGPKEYYATLFHELGHWSGHPARLDRLDRNARFGDAAYSFEELVAEIAGCFLCSEVGVPQSDDLSNQAAYLAAWLRVLRQDHAAVFRAASQASAATDYVLGRAADAACAAGASPAGASA